MLHIKKDDQVMIIAGKDKGKIGRILSVMPRAQRLIIENLNVVKKAKRRTQQNQQGGLIDTEMPIHISNVMLVDKKTNKSTRFGASILKDGSKVRISRKSGEAV